MFDVNVNIFVNNTFLTACGSFENTCIIKTNSDAGVLDRRARIIYNIGVEMLGLQWQVL